MSAPHRVRVDNLLGAPFVGNLAAAILYGMTCLQTYAVFKQKKDRIWLRSLVLILWTLASLHLIAVSSVLYYWLISNYDNPEALLTQNVWAATTYYMITAIMEFSIRSVFLLRIWKLSKRSWWLTASIFLTSLVDLVGSWTFALKNLSIKTFPNLSPISWLFYMAYGSSISADVITTVSLCVLLKKQSTGFRKTDSFLKSMMIYSVNTAALSSICSLLVLVTYAASNKFIFALFYFMLPGVMLNSLLATLYASQRLWERRQPVHLNQENSQGAIVSIPMFMMHSPSRTVNGFDERLEVLAADSSSGETKDGLPTSDSVPSLSKPPKSAMLDRRSSAH